MRFSFISSGRAGDFGGEAVRGLRLSTVPNVRLSSDSSLASAQKTGRTERVRERQRLYPARGRELDRSNRLGLKGVLLHFAWGPTSAQAARRLMLPAACVHHARAYEGPGIEMELVIGKGRLMCFGCLDSSRRLGELRGERNVGPYVRAAFTCFIRRANR